MSKMAGLQFSEQDQDLYKINWRISQGYAITHIYNGRHRTTRSAHLFVAYRAFGYKPDKSTKGIVSCDHINRNKLDNRRHNLRIVPISENNRNRCFNARCGIDQWNCKTSEKEVGDIRYRFHVLKQKQCEISKATGIPFKRIHEIVRNRTWRHLMHAHNSIPTTQD